MSANGSLDVLRYGRLLKARMLVGVRGAGMAYDGLYFVNSVTSTTSSAASIKQSFQLDAQRFDFDHTTGAGMSEGTKYYGKYRGVGDQQHRPDEMRASAGAGARCHGLIPSTWAMPCVPVAGHTRTACIAVPTIGIGRLGGVRARRSRLSDLGRLLLGLRRRGSGAGTCYAAG